MDPARPLDFGWTAVPRAAYYRLELETADGGRVHEAILPAGVRAYRAPPWLAARADSALAAARAGGGTVDALRWRVVALDAAADALRATGWRRLRLVPAPGGGR
jgi:hypothetical protein